MVAGDNLLLNLLLFKLTSVACLALSSWLLYRLAQRTSMAVPASVVMFFAWSPLVLFEAIGNGHNDIAMMTCVLAALLLTSYRHARSALVLLVVGALIKYTAALLIPLWLVYELNQLRRSTATGAGTLAPAPATEPAPALPARLGRRRSARALPPRAPIRDGTLSSTGRSVIASGRAALSGLAQLDRRAAVGLILSAGMLGAALTIAFYAPFWEGFHTFAGVGQQLRPLYYNGSLVQFVAAPLELLVPKSQYSSLDKTVRLLFYAIFGIYAWLQVHRLWMAGKQATLRDRRQLSLRPRGRHRPGALRAVLRGAGGLRAAAAPALHARRRRLAAQHPALRRAAGRGSAQPHGRLGPCHAGLDPDRGRHPASDAPGQPLWLHHARQRQWQRAAPDQWRHPLDPGGFARAGGTLQPA
jgi:hypothetical protein